MNPLIILAFVSVTVTKELPLEPARYIVSDKACLPDVACETVESQNVYGLGMPNYNNRVTSAPVGEPCLYVLTEPTEVTDPVLKAKMGKWRTEPYPQTVGDNQVWGYWISKNRLYRGRTTCEISQ